MAIISYIPTAEVIYEKQTYRQGYWHGGQPTEIG